MVTVDLLSAPEVMAGAVEAVGEVTVVGGGEPEPEPEPVPELELELDDIAMTSTVLVSFGLRMKLYTTTRSLIGSKRGRTAFPKYWLVTVPRTLFVDVTGPVVLGPDVEVLKSEMAPTLDCAGETLSHSGDGKMMLFR